MRTHAHMRGGAVAVPCGFGWPRGCVCDGPVPLLRDRGDSLPVVLLASGDKNGRVALWEL